jgi:hypothetical protein
MANTNRRTYMVAMQAEIILRPTVYLEVVATSRQDAMRQAKAEARVKGKTAFASRCKDQFLDECKTDLSDTFADQIGKAKVTAIDCGRASQYHSSAECELCQDIENQSRRN